MRKFTLGAAVLLIAAATALNLVILSRGRAQAQNGGPGEVGTYQLVANAQEGGYYVLDTRSGDIWVNPTAETQAEGTERKRPRHYHLNKSAGD